MTNPLLSGEETAKLVERLTAWMARGNPTGGMNLPSHDGKTPSIQSDLRAALALLTTQASEIERLRGERDDFHAGQFELNRIRRADAADTHQAFVGLSMEIKPMKSFEKAIEELVQKSSNADKPGDAMQFAQAALNAAHAAATLSNMKQAEK